MDEELRRSIEALAADSRSGASQLLPRAIAVLRAARSCDHQTLLEAARRVCASQPAMASFWNAAASALADGPPDHLERFEQRVRRAPAALARTALDVLLGSREAPAASSAPRPLHVTTCSFSGSVLGVLLALTTRTRLIVACAEGRPCLEGRGLAQSLAGAGVQVDFYTDAGIGAALNETDALLLGADAVAARWFLNKVGSGALAAAACSRGTPVYLVAGRDKFVPPQIEAALTIATHPADEVWDTPPPGVVIRNAYFERVPLDPLTALVTDAGLLTPDMVEEACRANGAGLSVEVTGRLLGGPPSP